MKYIFVDIDGTLIDRQGNIPESACEAIRNARSEGNKVFIATGRSRCEIFDSHLAPGFDGIVGASGGYIEIGGKVIESVSMTKEESERIIKILEENNIKFSVETNATVYNNEPTQNFLKKVFINMGRDIKTDPFYNMMTRTESFDNIKDVNKIIYYDTNIKIDVMRNIIGERYNIVPYSIKAFGENGGEINIKGVTKAAGIKRVLEHFGGRREDTAAIGDSENDIEMLKFVHTGVAMGNGSRSIIDCADFVTDDISNDGLAKAIQYILDK